MKVLQASIRSTELRFAVFLAVFSAGFSFGQTSLPPLVKGNRWVYTYSKGSSIRAMTRDSISRQEGVLSFTVDSLETFSGTDDTTCFRLSIIDSCFADSLIIDSCVLNNSLGVDSCVVKSLAVSSRRKAFSREFRVCNDTLYALDTASSPGFNPALLFYKEISDTEYSWVPWAPGNATELYRTTSTKVSIGMNQFDLIARIHVGTSFHVGATMGTSQSAFDTIQWIPGIGTVYYSEKYSSSTGYYGISSSEYCYTLQSFNDTAIPPFPKPVLGVKQAPRAIARPSAIIQKKLFLAKNRTPGPQFSNKICYNLRGQKVFGINGSQLLILSKATTKATPIK